MTPTAWESNEVAGGGWGKRNRGRERKPERGEGVSQGEEERESEASRYNGVRFYGLGNFIG